MATEVGFMILGNVSAIGKAVKQIGSVGAVVKNNGVWQNALTKEIVNIGQIKNEGKVLALEISGIAKAPSKLGSLFHELLDISKLKMIITGKDASAITKANVLEKAKNCAKIRQLNKAKIEAESLTELRQAKAIDARNIAKTDVNTLTKAVALRAEAAAEEAKAIVAEKENAIAALRANKNPVSNDARYIINKYLPYKFNSSEAMQIKKVEA